MQPLIYKSLLVFLCFGYICVQSQDEIVTFTKDDGLTSVLITASHVDSKGIVWIGTSNGLNAYTGTEWIPIKHIDDNKSGRVKPFGIVHGIFEDLNTNIWVSSDKGLFLYNRKYWTFFEPEGDNDYTVGEFFQDRSGAVWMTHEYFQDLNEDMGFSMVSGKLQMYNNGRWYKFDNDLAGTASLKFEELPKYFTSILQDRQGNMWFATLEGVFMFNGKEWSSFKKEELDANKIYDIIEDRNGTIWVATDNGVSRKRDENWENFSKEHGLADDLAYRIIEDTQGRIWAFSRKGTRFTGLSMFDGNKWNSYDDSELHLKGEIEELAWYNNDIIAFSNNGVSVFEEGKWKKFGKEDGLNGKNYSVIESYRRKDLWLAGNYGFYQYIDGNWKTLIEQTEKWKVLNIFRDKRGRVWLATNKMGLFVFKKDGWDHYNKENGLTDNHVSAIFEDRHRNIWVITKKGISKISTINPNQ